MLSEKIRLFNAEADAGQSLAGVLSQILAAITSGGARVTIELGKPVEPAEERSKPTVPFAPNPIQAAVLRELKGKSLRSTALAMKCAKGNQSTIFRKPGGIQELRDHGLVAWHRNIGFYRPDAPPPEHAKTLGLDKEVAHG